MNRVSQEKRGGGMIRKRKQDIQKPRRKKEWLFQRSSMYRNIAVAWELHKAWALVQSEGILY